MDTKDAAKLHRYIYPRSNFYSTDTDYQRTWVDAADSFRADVIQRMIDDILNRAVEIATTGAGVQDNDS